MIGVSLLQAGFTFIKVAGDSNFPKLQWIIVDIIFCAVIFHRRCHNSFWWNLYESKYHARLLWSIVFSTYTCICKSNSQWEYFVNHLDLAKHPCVGLMLPHVSISTLAYFYFTPGNCQNQFCLLVNEITPLKLFRRIWTIKIRVQ